jgi:hypothetical protein
MNHASAISDAERDANANGGRPVRRVGPKLPDVIAVGPPRTATTWMHRVFKGRINLPQSIKETRFFDLRYTNGLRWYASHFREAETNLPTVEFAPTYFYSPDARFRIAEKLPDARVVVTLREPVERLYSLYRLKCASGKLAESFEDALTSDYEMRESARYGHHLAEWISIFGRDRALVLIYEELKSDPQMFVDQLCDFFEVAHFELSPELRERENSAVEAVAPHLPAWTRIGVNASEWMRSHRYDRTMSLVHRLGIRRLFLSENGGEFRGSILTSRASSETGCCRKSRPSKKSSAVNSSNGAHSTVDNFLT